MIVSEILLKGSFQLIVFLGFVMFLRGQWHHLLKYNDVTFVFVHSKSTVSFKLYYFVKDIYEENCEIHPRNITLSYDV